MHTLADLSMVYSRPELTISFSDAPAIRALKAGVDVMGMDPVLPPENLASRLRCTLSAYMHARECSYTS